MTWWRRLAALLPALVVVAAPSWGRDDMRRVLLERLYAYADAADAAERQDTAYTYTKFDIRTRRRNAILWAVPTMYVVARGDRRDYVGESYERITSSGDMQSAQVERLLSRTTVPRRRRTMTTLTKYLTPDVYGETLFAGNILSPFYRHNRRFYRYRVQAISGGTATLLFRPRLNNTQLVSGVASIDVATGRILDARFVGEYDLIRFHIEVEMGDERGRSLVPVSCRLTSRFRFLGNDISADYLAMHALDAEPSLPPSDEGDTVALAAVRPVMLSEREDSLFATLYAVRSDADTAAERESRRSTLGRLLWDNVGEHLLNRTKSRFGARQQGYYRLSPLLNPLYFGYSNRKGLVYKVSLRAHYLLSANSMISMRAKAGYAFKQRQFYFDVPVRWTFDVRRDGYVEAEINNGNRITNSTVADEIKTTAVDSIDWGGMNLDYFKTSRLRVAAGIDLSSRFSVMGGIVVNRRSAVDGSGFRAAGWPVTYKSVAPMLELTYRPSGYGGAVLTLDYERSIKGLLSSTMEYERVEADGQYTLPVGPLASLRMRAGTGFYIHKSDDWIFLDYSNFHENNLPGGWGDDWACDFELLHSNWYNASEYYVRANVVYESPLMILSWLPLVGRLMERERIYVNALSVRHLHPYMEYGYGFTTRLASVGVFVGQRNGAFDGVGVRLALELFRNW